MTNSLIKEKGFTSRHSITSRYIYKLFLNGYLIAIIMTAGCKKFVEADLPVDQITSQFVYNNIGTATAAMSSVYASLAQNTSLFSRSLSFISDEGGFRFFIDPLQINDYTDVEFSGNVWRLAYMEGIYRCNSLMEGVNKSDGIAEDKKNILIGEAKFMRAFYYFYLVNLFGDVPLVLTTDYNQNSNIPRAPKEKIYDQIVEDLVSARELLLDDYLDAKLSIDNTERVRPNKAAATALLARVYLFRENWVKAEELATELIVNTSSYDLEDIDMAFLKNTKETIWAVQPDLMEPNGNVNTREGIDFVATGGFLDVAVYPFLYDAFEPDDARRDKWLGVWDAKYYPNKYKVGDVFIFGITDSREYSVMFRVAEQYLIRAEARAHQDKLAGTNSATEDINRIRARAGLPGITVTLKEDMLKTVMHERQVELFTEGGHRWFDLKRTGMVDSVMSSVTSIKGGEWEPYKILLPIPYSEFVNNPALRGYQNPGYLEFR